MQVKLNVIAAAAATIFAGSVSAQDMVVKIGHVAPVSGAQAHLGKDNENGARMAIEELNAKGVMIGGKPSSSSLPKTTGPIRSRALRSPTSSSTPR
jgi:branched-chain amino acid transport system substrate-binding protein